MLIEKKLIFICFMKIKSKIRKWIVNKLLLCILYFDVKDDILLMFVLYSDNDDE